MAAVRSPYWDNIKGILIILVVLGHAFWPYKNLDGMEYVVEVIYLFHMPAFVFVSGYLSRIKDRFAPKPYLQLLVSYFLINTLMLAYSYFVLGNDINLTRPYYSCWYLLALLVWRISLPVLAKCKGIIPLSIVFALVVGFSDEISNQFVLARIVSFYPFFIGGYFAAQKKLHEKLFEKPAWATAGGVLLLVVMTAASVPIVDHFAIGTSDELMQAYGSHCFDDLARRIIVILLACAFTAALLLAVPNKDAGFVTMWGRNSLTIYLFHRILTLLVARVFPASEFEWYFAVIGLVASAIILAILGLDSVNKAYSGFVSHVCDVILTPAEELEKPHQKTIAKVVFVAVALLALAEPGIAELLS